jgi:Ca2+-transporting ATPase
MICIQNPNCNTGGIARFGGASAALLFFVLIIKYGVLFHRPIMEDGTLQQKDPAQHIQEFFGIVILCVTVVVVAVPEGLPLAVTLALAFATKRMTKDNNLVRHLKSCETMGNATVICSDKTGTLTQNVMTVVAGAFGRGTLRAGDTSKLPSKEMATYSDGSTGSASSDESAPSLRRPPVEIPLYQLHDHLPQECQLLLKELIAANSTAFEGEQDGKPVFIGSKTETALLDFAQRCLGLGNLKTERAQSNIIQYFPFDSGKKCMGVVVKEDDNRYRLYIKGASEIVLSKCSHVLKEPTASLDSMALSDEDRVHVRNIISSYASKSLRTIALAYREFQQWPPANTRIISDNPSHAEFDDVFHGLTWLSVVGIQDPVRPGVPEAIEKCERAGVRVIMVTGDNLETAKAIARECGILKENGVILDGSQFRRMSESELEQILPKLCVLARSSPEDKKVLVTLLQSKKNIVAVTGDGTNDAPALRAADVGFSMGITGTEVAKESSDIILMDDNFASIVRALAWGRAINDAVKKFLQFQVTVNITAVILTFASSVSAVWYARGSGQSNDQTSDEASVINAVQLLWVNLIMDSFAALALATDPPNDSLFDRKPEPRGLPLINHTMWKMIWCQFIFQTAVALTLYFAGPTIPLIRDWDTITQNTLIFNVFVWSQIFNLFNCRRIDNSMNIFHAITKNTWLLGILLVMVGGQILIVFVGGSAFVVKRLPWEGWVISILVGALSIPVAFLTRKFIPDYLFRFPKWLWWLSWAKLERQSGKPSRKKEYVRTDSSDDRDIFARAVSSKLQKQFNRGRRTNLVTQGFLHPLRRRSQSSVAAAVILPGALASSLGTPSDGRSIRSQSVHHDGILEV